MTQTCHISVLMISGQRPNFHKMSRSPQICGQNSYMLQGGNLKIPKCYYCLMLWTSTKGRAKIKTICKSCSLRQITIPQQDSTEAQICRKEAMVPEENLGVITSPTSTDGGQLWKLLDKAYKWTGSIRAAHLSTCKVWHSLQTQVLPLIRYGLFLLMEEPQTVEQAFMDWAYYTLPSFGINRNITADWIWIPWKYEGLGLPNIGVKKGPPMIEYVLCHWDTDDIMGTQLHRSFEIAQLECRLHGNFLWQSYPTFEALVSHSWFKIR